MIFSRQGCYFLQSDSYVRAKSVWLFPYLFQDSLKKDFLSGTAVKHPEPDLAGRLVVLHLLIPNYLSCSIPHTWEAKVCPQWFQTLLWYYWSWWVRSWTFLWKTQKATEIWNSCWGCGGKVQNYYESKAYYVYEMTWRSQTSLVAKHRIHHGTSVLPHLKQYKKDLAASGSSWRGVKNDFQWWTQCSA